MSAHNKPGELAPTARPEVKYSKWRYIYFVLAAFDLMTVLAGLYLNHRIMDIYTGSVEVNRVWADRVAAYSHLGELAENVNTPGNDIFDSRNVAVESQRMRTALSAFDRDLAERRQELRDNLEPAVAQPLLDRFDAIDRAKTEMTVEAERIFEYFHSRQPEQAGERMATMDHKYAKLNGALLDLRRAVGAIQEQNFKQQMAAAAELQRYEYVIGLLIALMVAGAVFYGHRVAQQMQVDADEKQRHFEGMEAAEARTRSIVDTAADGIITFDAGGRIDSFNKAAERMFGYASADAVGRDIRALIPALAPGLSATDAVDAGERPAPTFSVPNGECRGLRRDGTDFPLELSASQVSVGDSRVFTGIVRDMSERRRTEEALRAAAAAQAASRAKSQFLANMSHEIRTPMNGVLGMAEMLLDSKLTAAQRRYAETVHRSGEVLLALIDDILDLSKIEAGKLELECVDFSPRDLTDEVLQLLSEDAERKGLDLSCRIADDVPPALRGAASRLRQVLTNLVGNAVKFTEHGEVRVDVSALAPTADEAAADDSAGTLPAAATVVLHFVVADTGIGIPAAVQERLFTAFTQADNSTTRRFGGSGLGLAIAKELVERMGGQIGVRSKAERGTEFWFTVRLELTSPADSIPAPGPHALGGRRALVLAGKSTGRRQLEQHLRGIDLQVRCVDDGGEGIDLLRRAARSKNAYALAVVDAALPKRTLLSFARAVRADASLADTALVLLVPAGTPGDLAALQAAGFQAQLRQPMRADDWLASLADLVGANAGARVAAPGRATEASALGGVRVLLAEDNPVNQDVTRSMLESLDCDVCVVDNGVRAIDALSRARFDIVLLDCQMPEMDGFATSAEIRSRGLLRPRQPPGMATPLRLPIVALTANAIAGDREKCLAAGMDDYLAKPFRREALHRLIKRWVGDEAVAEVSVEERAEEVATDAAPLATLDRRTLDQIRRNRPPGAPCPVGTLIDLYFANSAEMIAALDQAGRRADCAALARSAHSLKSGSAFLGARRLAGLCAEIERSARAENLQGIDRQLDAVQREYAEVRTALDAVR